MVLSVPGSLLLVSGLAQLRRGVGHWATASVLVAIGVQLALIARFLTPAQEIGAPLLCIILVFVTHLAAVLVAFFHAETRRRCSLSAQPAP